MSSRPIRVLIAEEDADARGELVTLVQAEPTLELADVVSPAPLPLPLLVGATSADADIRG